MTTRAASLPKSRTSPTDQIVLLFRAGWSMSTIANTRKVPLLMIENAIRRWMNLNAETW